MRLLYIVLLICVMATLAAMAYCAETAAPAESTAPQSAAAPPSPPPPPPFRPARIMCPSVALSLPGGPENIAAMASITLTEDQKPKLAAAQKTYDDKIAQLNTAMQAAMKQLVEAMCAKDTPATKLKELAAQAGKIDADAFQARVDFIAEMKKTLTEKQFESIAEMLKRRALGIMNAPPGGFPREGSPGIQPPTSTPAPPPPAPAAK